MKAYRGFYEGIVSLLFSVLAKNGSSRLGILGPHLQKCLDVVSMIMRIYASPLTSDTDRGFHLSFREDKVNGSSY